jgi:hypothetical protein
LLQRRACSTRISRECAQPLFWGAGVVSQSLICRDRPQR